MYQQVTFRYSENYAVKCLGVGRNHSWNQNSGVEIFPIHNPKLIFEVYILSVQNMQFI